METIEDRLGEIRKEIIGLGEEDYRVFQKKLLPDVKNYAGVRLPRLRRIARRIAREDAKGYLEAALEKDRDTELFEEIMLQGMVIGYWEAELPVIFLYADRLIQKIDNWSVCDSFCSGLKRVRTDPEETWRWLMGYLGSPGEFAVRFGVVMLLDYYITEDYIRRLFPVFDGISHKGYYVKMAVAWAVSVCYVRYPHLTQEYLADNRLDDFTFRSTLRKIIESHGVSAREKDRIRRMKRPEGHRQEKE